IRATVTLTLLVGVILIAASALRLGFVANFISDPVLIGFKAGIGLVIVVDQVPKLLGIHFAKGTFLHNLIATFGAIPASHLPTLAVGVITLLLLVGVERALPRGARSADRRGAGDRGGRPVRIDVPRRRHRGEGPAGAAVLYLTGSV